MKSIEDYTVIEILEKYKKIIGKDIESIVYSTFFQSDRERILMKKQIDDQMKKLGGLEKTNLNREEVAYKLIKFRLLNSEDVNKLNTAKLIILVEVYRRFASQMTEKEEKNLKNLILGEQAFTIYEYYHDKYAYNNDEKNQNNTIYKYEIITRDKQEKVKSIYDEKSREVFTRSIEEILEFNDFSSVIKSEYLKDAYEKIKYNIMVEILLDKNRMTAEEFNKNLSENDFSKILEVPEIKKEYEQKMREFFMNNLHFINKNELLLNSAARIILGIKTASGEVIDGVTLKDNSVIASKEVMEASIKFLKNISRELSKQVDGNKYEYTIYSNSGTILSVNREYIDDILSKCTKNEYVTNRNIEDMHREILNGNFTKNIEKRRIANVNLDDLVNANNSYEEKEDGTLEKDKILTSNIELAKYLVDEGIATNEDLLNMYLQGNLNLKLITGIDINELSEEYCSNKFKNLYYEMVFTQEPEKVKETLERFSALYVYLEKINKIAINRDELIGDIITILGDQFAPEILSDLHELNFITLDKAIEWVGSDILFEEYKKGNLKPGEVRRFYEDKIIDLSGIANVINKLSDNGNKFMVIGSIFPEETEEDREIRDLLIDECLKIDSEIENNKVGNKRKNGDNKSNDYYKHITDPFARISLIKALDKDYSFEMTSDGHAIVKLPNLKKVIIEKMLDKNKEPSYGAGTYILDELYYEDNSFRIKKDGKIARQEIIKDIDSKQVTRIIHSINSWGKNIKSYFIDEQKSNWSKEELKTINEAIDRVKRSEKIIGDKKVEKENKSNLIEQCDEKELAKMILNLIVTRKATLEQVEKIAEIYGVDLGKVMNSLDER